MSEQSTSNKPWVSNYPPLKAWLDKIDARLQDRIPVGEPIKPTAYLEKWGTPDGRTFIVEVCANMMGWNIYTDKNTQHIDLTLTDAEKRLGM